MENLAEVIMRLTDKLGTIRCPSHGDWDRRLKTAKDLDGANDLTHILPVPCCCRIAFEVFYAFDRAWATLPPMETIRRSTGIKVMLGNSKTKDFGDQALFKLRWRDDLRSMISEFGRCEEHETTKSDVELVHLDDGFSYFAPHGCCTRFEEAAKFFIFVCIEPTVTPE
jgi:hypothetical protein